MGLFDRFRKQKTSIIRTEPKKRTSRKRPSPSIKTPVPLTSSNITPEDLMRELKSLYVLLVKRLDKVEEMLKVSGRVLVADRLFIKGELVRMVKDGTPRKDAVEYWHEKEGVPTRTLYRWLKE